MLLQTKVHEWSSTPCFLLIWQGLPMSVKGPVHIWIPILNHLISLLRVLPMPPKTNTKVFKKSSSNLKCAGEFGYPQIYGTTKPPNPSFRAPTRLTTNLWKKTY